MDCGSGLDRFTLCIYFYIKSLDKSLGHHHSSMSTCVNENCFRLQKNVVCFWPVSPDMRTSEAVLWSDSLLNVITDQILVECVDCTC